MSQQYIALLRQVLRIERKRTQRASAAWTILMVTNEFLTNEFTIPTLDSSRIVLRDSEERIQDYY